MIELPLNGRNPAQLTALVAGAVNAPSNNSDQGSTKTFPAAVTVSVNGGRSNNISFNLDGVHSEDIFSNVPADKDTSITLAKTSARSCKTRRPQLQRIARAFVADVPKHPV